MLATCRFARKTADGSNITGKYTFRRTHWQFSTLRKWKIQVEDFLDLVKCQRASTSSQDRCRYGRKRANSFRNLRTLSGGGRVKCRAASIGWATRPLICQSQDQILRYFFNENFVPVLGFVLFSQICQWTIRVFLQKKIGASWKLAILVIFLKNYSRLVSFRDVQQGHVFWLLVF